MLQKWWKSKTQKVRWWLSDFLLKPGLGGWSSRPQRLKVLETKRRICRQKGLTFGLSVPNHRFTYEIGRCFFTARPWRDVFKWLCWHSISWGMHLRDSGMFFFHLVLSRFSCCIWGCLLQLLEVLKSTGTWIHEDKWHVWQLGNSWFVEGGQWLALEKTHLWTGVPGLIFWKDFFWIAGGRFSLVNAGGLLGLLARFGCGRKPHRPGGSVATLNLADPLPKSVEAWQERLEPDTPPKVAKDTAPRVHHLEIHALWVLSIQHWRKLRTWPCPIQWSVSGRARLCRHIQGSTLPWRDT